MAEGALPWAPAGSLAITVPQPETDVRLGRVVDRRSYETDQADQTIETALGPGGAVGIRANGPGDVAAIRAAVDLPIVGIYKVDLPGFEVRITPTLDHARQIAAAGADLILNVALHIVRSGAGPT